VQEREDFHRGVKAVLDYLEGFWMGLEKTGGQRRQDLEGPAAALSESHKGARN
jgi:hypothetical protein